jgi:hypothetical protein
MASAVETFVLIGPHAGKDMSINGHEFEDGEFVFQGSADQIIALTNIFSFYGAVPKAEAKRMAMEAELAELRSRNQPSAATAAELAPQPSAVAVTVATPDSTSTTTTITTAPTAEQVAAFEADLGKPVVSTTMSLGEAIGALSPDADADWTSNNLPSLDRLAELVGKKPSRDEVEAIATGYTRAKARTARGS